MYALLFAFAGQLFIAVEGTQFSKQIVLNLNQENSGSVEQQRVVLLGKFPLNSIEPIGEMGIDALASR